MAFRNRIIAHSPGANESLKEQIEISENKKLKIYSIHASFCKVLIFKKSF